MKITIEMLIRWAVETNASLSDIEHELNFNGFDIALFDFVELVNKEAAKNENH